MGRQYLITHSALRNSEISLAKYKAPIKIPEFSATSNETGGICEAKANPVVQHFTQKIIESQETAF